MAAATGFNDCMEMKVLNTGLSASKDTTDTGVKQTQEKASCLDKGKHIQTLSRDIVNGKSMPSQGIARSETSAYKEQVGTGNRRTNAEYIEESRCRKNDAVTHFSRQNIRCNTCGQKDDTIRKHQAEINRLCRKLDEMDSLIATHTRG